MHLYRISQERRKRLPKTEDGAVQSRDEVGQGGGGAENEAVQSRERGRVIR